MKTNNKTIGIIGCGLIADTHIEAIKESVSNIPVCVCDPLPGKADLLKKKYNLKSAYNTIEEMLSKEKPFSVHILSPPQFHVEHSIMCLKAGCHVLVEKPLAFNYKDVDLLYKVAKEYKKVLCVDHSLLCQPSIMKMFEKMRLLDDDQILYVNSFYGIDKDSLDFSVLPINHWKHTIPGGTIIDTIIHPVSFAVELTGKPREIKTTYSSNNENIEELHTFWKSDGAMVSITVSSQAQPFRRTTEVISKKQTFIIDHSTETLVSLDTGFGPKSLRKIIRNFQYGFQLISGTLSIMIKYFKGRIKENPGTRGMIECYYRHLELDDKIPVTEENVRNAVYTLERIITAIKKSSSNKKNSIQRLDEKPVKVLSENSNISTLVTGASGLLGRHICEILSDKRRKIIAQVRRGLNADKLYKTNIDKIYEDFSIEHVDYNNLVDGVKEIVHCAHAAGAKTWEQFKLVNVDATIALYKAAKAAGCEKFIFISSVAVYGVHKKKSISVDEKTRAILGKSKWDFYIRSKTLAERELFKIAEKGGPRLIIIRPGILYSTDGFRLARKSIPLKNGKLIILFGNGKNYIPYTRVDVLAKTICKILDCNETAEGIYNMTGDSEENSKEFMYSRLQNLGIKCKFISIPAFPLRFLGLVLEYLYIISFKKKSPKITRYIIDSGTRDIHYDCSKAEKEIGWDSKAAI